MALRIKRGTNAERLAYTPELGELIYVTNYVEQSVAPLWVGDGSTEGGNPVGSGSGGGGSGIENVVEDLTPELGGNLSLNNYQINGIGDIDITGTITASASITANTFNGLHIGNVLGNVDGDVNGSVFADDSTPIVDGVSGEINTRKINVPDGVDFKIRTEQTSGFQDFKFENAGGQARLYLQRESTTEDLAQAGTNYGRLNFSRDDINGFALAAFIQAGFDGFQFRFEGPLKDYPTTSHINFDQEGRIENFSSITSPRFNGDLVGSVFADDSTQLVDGPNGTVYPASINDVGDVVTNNPQTGQILAWNGSEWTNENNVGGGGGGGGGTAISVGADDSALRIINPGEGFLILGGANITTASDAEGNITITGPSAVSELTNDSGYLTTVAFADLTGTPTTVAGYGITDAVTTADVGSFTFAGSTIDTSDSSLITVTPAATFNSDVTVENNLVVSNTVVCDTLEVQNIVTASGAGTPELESDTELLLTAATRVEVTQSPLKMASFTTAERDALTAENGDTIYNTTTNKFQGYANGSWVDLH